jgi:hypothetical protein
MTTPPGADERRTRMNLRRIIDGTPPPVAPPRPHPGGDWWERLYDDTKDDHAGAVPKRRRIPTLKRPVPAKPQAEEQPADTEPEWEDADPVDESTPQAVRRDRRNPAREWQAGWAQINRRTRWLVLNGGAAGTGWFAHLAPLFRSWIADCGHQSGTGAALWLGGGLILATAIADGSAQGWRPAFLVWVCRIPLASAVLAVALYAPGAAQ